jgi:serine/threonine-protein kinase
VTANKIGEQGFPGGTPDFTGKHFGNEGQYRIVRKIGQGGGGTVWEGFDEVKKRRVAVKVLSMDGYASREMIERFKREGQKFGALCKDHENIVRVYAFGREQGFFYIVSEYVEGKNLYQLLVKHGPFPVDRALDVISRIAGALKHAHDNQIIHRDLKPENVMVRDADGVVKVLDFGIAKDLNASVALTRHGTYIGTPAYSAPEQIRGELIDHRADIFSMGVILYELLTGEQPFKGRKTVEVLQATMKERPLPVEKLNNLVTRPVCKLIEKMIEKNPKRRFQACAELLEAVNEVTAALKEPLSLEDNAGVMQWLKRLFGGDPVAPGSTPS